MHSTVIPRKFANIILPHTLKLWYVTNYSQVLQRHDANVTYIQIIHRTVITIHLRPYASFANINGKQDS